LKKAGIKRRKECVRILSFYPTKTFKLILEFENNQYRVLDMQKFLHNEQGLLKDICSDINLFMLAELDQISGTIRFSNEVDFDNNVLYEVSQDLEKFMKIDRNFPKPRKITRLSDNQSEISKENQRVIRLLRGF
jgi:hypothetical protein